MERKKWATILLNRFKNALLELRGRNVQDGAEQKSGFTVKEHVYKFNPVSYGFNYF